MNNISKKGVSLLIVAVMVLSTVTTISLTADAAICNSEPVESENRDYGFIILDDDSASITSYKGTAGDIIIPNQLDGHKVTAIGSQAFWHSTVTSVVIPNGVTSIENNAFNNCLKLEKVSIPNSVKIIESSTFIGCTKLKDVNVPDSVTSIGHDAFFNTGYYLDKNNWTDNALYMGNHLIEANTSVSGYYKVKVGTKTIADMAFDYSPKLLGVSIPNSVINIGEEAFNSCTQLKSVTIPNSVKGIGKNAFKDCSALADIKIPDSVTSIGAKAFFNTAYYNDSVNRVNGVLYIGNHLIDAKITKLTIYNIKDGTKNIADNAFSGCTELLEIKIPNTVTSIGKLAFWDCTALSGVDIPNGVRTIGEGAFNNCSGIEKVTIPRSITAINDKVFLRCTKLSYINIPNSVTSIGFSAFEDCPNLKSITIPNSIKTIKASAFENCTGLTSVEIPTSVTDIGTSAFRSDSNLTSIIIPQNVARIGYFAFEDCKELAIYGYKNTYAEEYATKNKIPFIDLLAPKMEDCKITLSYETTIYDGTKKEPVITVTINGATLKKATDYIVEYENNVNVGTATVIVTSKGNFRSKVIKSFRILPKTIDASYVTLDTDTYVYDGTEKKPTVTVELGSIAFTKDKDYTVRYINNINVGTATVIITGIGNISGTVTKTFNINQKTILSGNVTLDNDIFLYDGTEKKPNVAVNINSRTLVKDVDYTISYKDNIKIGIGIVTVKGKGNYKGTVSRTFKITNSLPKPNYKVGDVNGDGRIDIRDATEIQKYIVEIISFDEVQKVAADTNGDGNVDILDVTHIQKYLVELIDKLG